MPVTQPETPDTCPDLWEYQTCIVDRFCAFTAEQFRCFKVYPFNWGYTQMWHPINEKDREWYYKCTV